MSNVSIFSSGKDGFFDLTHVGTGERLKVQESWAKYHPIIEEGRDCVIAYLGIYIVHCTLYIVHCTLCIVQCTYVKEINMTLCFKCRPKTIQANQSMTAYTHSTVTGQQHGGGWTGKVTNFPRKPSGRMI